MDTSNMLGLAGLAGAAGFITTAWGSIRSWALTFRNLLITSISIEQGAARAVHGYMLTRTRNYPLGPERINSMFLTLPASNRSDLVPISYGSKSRQTLCLLGRAPVIMSVVDGALTLTYVRGTVDVSALLRKSLDTMYELCDKASASTSKYLGGIKIYRHSSTVKRRDVVDEGKKPPLEEPSGKRGELAYEDARFWGLPLYGTWSWKDYTATADKSSLATIRFDEKLESILAEAVLWKRSQAWFEDRGLPWKRGLLLEGVSGSGKSTFVKKLAYELCADICILQLGGMCSSEFADIWDTVSQNGQGNVVVIEDIDAVFDGRRNVSGCSKEESADLLDYSTFLNALDGVNSGFGYYLVVTTNNLDKVDPALAARTASGASRPGRIDRIASLNEASLLCRMAIADRTMAEMPEESRAALVSRTQGMTAAQVQNEASNEAIAYFWNKKAAEELAKAE